MICDLWNRIKGRGRISEKCFKNRFFIYDLKQNKILNKGLVGHGTGSETGIPGKLKFSNLKDSHCTSLGKYAIGTSYQGSFGKSYKLYGLDKTNSNASDRNVVLHEYSKVPFEEQENPICNSYGCPMVNSAFFNVPEKIIDTSAKKIILVIYY
ncbi:murein L,D-transpeptidase catalytic domain-containing protein [Flavobacterium sp. ENC]|uniref:murein L,D-transpeptidase catalytic domain-containing protein n=1 Tax=Flavobacterium sp. ENC TaxID=2897330 RepID=UPI001E30E2C8|nr:murein L,D-transpeptidase catalytic domain family protein [Flavobacterium sp. ENC]MCD0464541.1 murein L,D-transpeptidase catalytic domain family protein [Flavobacterium sp. ENC]